MEQYNKGYRYVAFSAENFEYEQFRTIEEAQSWLSDRDLDGISGESIDGRYWIAEITYKYTSEIVACKDDYCEDSSLCDNCPYGKSEDNCDMEEWPIGSEFDFMCERKLEKIDWDK